MIRREHAKLRRGVIPLLCSVLALALLAVGAAVVLRPSENPGPEKVQAIPVIETGSINPSGATIGFADSDLYGRSPEDINRTFDLMRQTGVSQHTIERALRYAGNRISIRDRNILDSPLPDCE